MNKAQAIIHHYGSGVADFVIRASGKMEWNGPGECPTDEQIEQWESERIKSVAIEKQNQKIIKLIDEADKKSSAEYRNSIEDKEKWKIYGDKLIIILKSGILQEIPSKPF